MARTLQVAGCHNPQAALMPLKRNLQPATSQLISRHNPQADSQAIEAKFEKRNSKNETGATKPRWRSGHSNRFPPVRALCGQIRSKPSTDSQAIEGGSQWRGRCRLQVVTICRPIHRSLRQNSKNETRKMKRESQNLGCDLITETDSHHSSQ